MTPLNETLTADPGTEIPTGALPQSTVVPIDDEPAPRPRVGHLHITVDDLPWLWADFGQSNTIVLAGMPRGQHKVLIELVDAEGNVFTAQTVTFQSPGKEARP